MNFPQHGLAPIGVALALATAGTAAMATTSASSVLITSFSYAASAGTLAWSDPYQTFAATALNAGGLLGANSDAFATDDYFIAIVGASTSTASAAGSTTTPQTFWATANTASSVGAISNVPNKAESIIGQSGSFSLSAAGTVTFTIGYQLAVSAVGGNALSDYGSALLAFNLADDSGTSGGNLNASLLSFAQATGSGSRTGTFTLTVDLANGEAGYYNLQGNALAYSTAAAVPEPTSWSLLACGLVGMAAWVRSRRSPTHA